MMSQMGKYPEGNTKTSELLKHIVVVGAGGGRLTLDGYSMDLTATVYSYAQHGCFIPPLQTFAFHRVRQEGQIGHNNAMGLPDIIQLL